MFIGIAPALRITPSPAELGQMQAVALLEEGQREGSAIAYPSDKAAWRKCLFPLIAQKLRFDMVCKVEVHPYERG